MGQKEEWKVYVENKAILWVYGKPLFRVRVTSGVKWEMCSESLWQWRKNRKYLKRNS